ncbi:MAG: SCP2 sterol-binding domain-containing protein [Pseudomonadales bacterium]
MIELTSLAAQVQARFNSQAASGIQASFQFNLSDGQAFYVTIHDGKCSLTQGVDSAASIAFTLSEKTLSDVVNAQVNALQAFMAGDIQAEGDMTLAPILAQVFSA